MRVTIDRIEEDVAVLLLDVEPVRRFTLPVALLPPGSCEGDVLTLLLERDEDETRAARARSAGLIARLRQQ
jgi:hypothetical protein